jgi:hypothetical protein
MEPQPAIRGTREHPVEHEGVQVDVEIERAAKALDDDDRHARA